MDIRLNIVSRLSCEELPSQSICRDQHPGGDGALFSLLAQTHCATAGISAGQEASAGSSEELDPFI
jgi:hypothetical protein